MNPQKLAILASGAGTNAENLINYFRGHNNIKIAVLISNNPHSGIFDIGERHDIQAELLSNTKGPEALLALLSAYKIDYIILAGYLKLIHKNVIKSYPAEIINIHPALLPAYGGKGMYGMAVHKAVINNREARSGITIHLVNEEYDKGRILAQHSLEILPGDSAESLARRIHALEYKHFPGVIEEYILNNQ